MQQFYQCFLHDMCTFLAKLIMKVWGGNLKIPLMNDVLRVSFISYYITLVFDANIDMHIKYSALLS